VCDCRLCEHDADMLYQRLESQVREVVIEMKVRLLRELTVDHKVETRAHQFVSLLLSEYADLCASSQCATFIASFVSNNNNVTNTQLPFNLTETIYACYTISACTF